MAKITHYQVVFTGVNVGHTQWLEGDRIPATEIPAEYLKRWLDLGAVVPASPDAAPDKGPSEEPPPPPDTTGPSPPPAPPGTP